MSRGEYNLRAYYDDKVIVSHHLQVILSFKCHSRTTTHDKFLNSRVIYKHLKIAGLMNFLIFVSSLFWFSEQFRVKLQPYQSTKIFD